jgi:CRISPR-associated endonuclease/helicase Cas3
MPRRIVLVVDRRIVVDDAFARAAHIVATINSAASGPLLTVQRALATLGGEVPLHATVLRGAIHRDERWARTPVQPTLVISTVDQVGSRLLFRGYGLGSGSLPIHAGLLANDTLLILDEAHLSRPFEETLEWIAHLRTLGEAPLNLPFAFVRMTATPPPGLVPFATDDADRQHPVLMRRLGASKPARLVDPVEPKALAGKLAALAAAEAAPGRSIAVVANRVATARQVLERLRADKKLGAELLLLTGRSRSHERDQLLARFRDRLNSGRDRSLHAEGPPVIVVATQCIEAGADLDFDFLLTECAPLDALRQRFGRLDRLGELPPAEGCRAAIVIDAKSAKPGEDDPVYGPAIASTWAWLSARATNGIVDFGITALVPPPDGELLELLSPRVGAPILQRAYCDLLAQTAPEPEPSPDPAAFLHGVERNDPEVQLVWRADLGEDPNHWADVVALCPPVASEALPIRLSAARAWLAAPAEGTEKGLLNAVDADLEGMAAPAAPKKSKPTAKAVAAAEEADDDDDEGDSDSGEESEASEPSSGDGRGWGRRPALRWRGAENSAIAGQPGELRPGDTLVIPSDYGGCDCFGWNPEDRAAVEDLAEAARARAGRARVVRLHPALPPPAPPSEALAPLWAVLRQLKEEPEVGLRAYLREQYAEAGESFPSAVRPLMHPSGIGLVLIWPEDAKQTTFEDAGIGSSRSALGGSITLEQHNRDVGAEAGRFAQLAGLSPDLVALFQFAGEHHDLGKADPRFQALLRGGNRLAALREGELLAKSDRTPRTAAEHKAARDASGYPAGGRHELLSVRLLESSPALPDSAVDRDLLLHLIASHHGHCRPFAPIVGDPAPVTVRLATKGQSLQASSATGLERLNSGVSRRYFRLTRRYGWWGLAYLESLLRLADHRVSERGPQED